MPAQSPQKAKVRRRASGDGPDDFPVLVGLSVLMPSASARQGAAIAVSAFRRRAGTGAQSVNSIYQDRRGYLWFGTAEGLSRFDGYRFTNYTTRDGLESHNVNAVAEDQQGRLWVAAPAGVARFLEQASEAPAANPQKKFLTYRVGASPWSNAISNLAIDADNVLWCATWEGLYRAEVQPSGDVQFELAAPGQRATWGHLAFLDSRKHLWFGMAYDFVAIVQGQAIKHRLGDKVKDAQFASIVEDHQGRLLVANLTGVFAYAPTADGQGEWQRLPIEFKITGQSIHALATDAGGALWVGTSAGLVKV